VRKVAWALRELNLEYERLEAGGTFGVVDSPQYRQHNPNGLCAAARRGRLRAVESNVIVRYLCAKHAPGTLYPNRCARAPMPSAGWTGSRRR